MLAGTQYKACLPETARGLFVPPGDWGRTAHALAGRDVPCPGPMILLAHKGRGREHLCQANPGCACSFPANMACAGLGVPAVSIPLPRAGALGLGHPAAACAGLALRGGTVNSHPHGPEATEELALPQGRAHMVVCLWPGGTWDCALLAALARVCRSLRGAATVVSPGLASQGVGQNGNQSLCSVKAGGQKRSRSKPTCCLRPPPALWHGGNVLVWGLISAPLPPLWLSNTQLGRSELMHCI